MDQRKHLAERFLDFAVVDPRVGDYETLVAEFAPLGVHWQFAATAGEALRLAKTRQMGLWLINTKLADMSGMQLCAMLKNMNRRQAVGLVADAYDVEDEREARIQGASLFVCKPPGPAWSEFIAMTLHRFVRESQPTRPAVVQPANVSEIFPIHNH